MNILITGANGQLGNELARQLAGGGSALGPIPATVQGAKVAGVDIQDGDLAKLDDARALFERYAPDAVLNCAAFTNVDACETERDAALRANAVAVRNLAMLCEERGAKCVHVSTDYVFSGQGHTPLDESARPAPRSVYGATKLLGEEYLRDFSSRWFILRTAWLYGRVGGNFLRTIQRVAREAGKATVVDDQLGNPTNAEDLAHHMLKLLPTDEYGLYHCTGEGVCSWFDFAREIVRASGIEAEVLPITTDEYPGRPAPRPAYSALDNAMLRATVGDEMRPWQAALDDYIAWQKAEGEIEA